MQAPGTLFVVATPIGNLSDITHRAVEVLRMVDLIAAEDTRHSGMLLATLGISRRMIALHQHNEQSASSVVIEQLLAGQQVALISDAGTPAISDPGAQLVAQALAAGIRVSPVPGASAAVDTMSVAGMTEPGWLFVGFLPARAAQRRKQLAELASLPHAMVIYEAPHRILECVADLYQILGDRRIVLTRELTKLFETVHATTLAEAGNWLAADPQRQRGEFVLIVGGALPDTGQDASNDRLRDTLAILLAELPVSQAAHLAARLTGQRKNLCYQTALAMQQTQTDPRE